MELNNNSNNVLLLLAAIQQQQQQINLLEALFTINQDPSADAIETIAQRIGSTNQDVASWFHHRREQHRARQATAAAEAAAAAAAASTHLGNLVLNNLLLDPQQLQQHLQQHHHQSGLSLNCLPNSNGTGSGVTGSIGGAGVGGGGGGGTSSGGGSANNLSQYYYDYPISNASSSPTIQQPIQVGSLNSTPAGADSPPRHLQNNNTHHQDTSPSSSSILAKLTAVTSGLASAQSAGTAGAGGPLSLPSHNHPNHVLTCSGGNKLDSRMIDLLEALYAINDNPEMGAIEMISKRVDVPCHLISEWFDKKRMKLNPFAGPRSPPVNKKREGGRVVTFSEYQRSLLEAIFNENNYLHPQEYEELSKLIQVPSRNIKIWFKNRRSKQRLSSGSRVVGNVRCDSDSIDPNQHLNHHHLQ